MIRFFIHSLVVVTIITSLLVSVYPLHHVELGYDLLWLHPLIFLFVYIFIFIPLLKLGKYNITVYSFITLAWLRYVLLPFGSSMSGVYNGVSYIYVGSDSAQSAILLVAYELIITSVFLYLLVISSARKGIKNNNHNLSLKGNKSIYAIFIIMAIIIYFVLGRSSDLIQFFIISADSGERRGDLDSTWLVLIRQIIITCFIFIFVWSVSFCKREFEKTNKKIYINYAIMVGILNIGIIVGERRSIQLYTALIVMFVLVHAFYNYRKRIISIISISAILVLLFMSIYKHFAAFAHGSYLSAVGTESFDLDFLTSNLQLYFFGTQNVAAVLELKRYTDLNIINMFYDFGRSFFGLSFLLKEQMVMTSEVFNSFIYGDSIAAGHLMSGLGYGFLYLGPILSPIFVCFNIFISSRLEMWFNKTSSIEMKYIVGLILVRFSTNLFSTTPPLISFSTMILFTSGLLYFVAIILKKNKYKM